MRIWRLSLALALALLPAVAGAGEGVTVEAAWARATSPVARAGAVYLTIGNAGAAADTLTGIATDRAAMAMLHRTTTSAEGVSAMEAVPALEIPPGAAMTLEPGAMHIMLSGLEAPLSPGDRFDVVLTFTGAGAVTVPVVVLGPAARGPEG